MSNIKILSCMNFKLWMRDSIPAKLGKLAFNVLCVKNDLNVLLAINDVSVLCVKMTLMYC